MYWTFMVFFQFHQMSHKSTSIAQRVFTVVKPSLCLTYKHNVWSSISDCTRMKFFWKYLQTHAFFPWPTFSISGIGSYASVIVWQTLVCN